jgi:hypothetical protein
MANVLIRGYTGRNILVCTGEFCDGPLFIVYAYSMHEVSSTSKTRTLSDSRVPDSHRTARGLRDLKRQPFSVLT